MLMQSHVHGTRLHGQRLARAEPREAQPHGGHRPSQPFRRSGRLLCRIHARFIQERCTHEVGFREEGEVSQRKRRSIPVWNQAALSCCVVSVSVGRLDCNNAKTFSFKSIGLSAIASTAASHGSIARYSTENQPSIRRNSFRRLTKRSWQVNATPQKCGKI